MGQYLLATYRVEDEVPGAPSSPEEMQKFMQRVIALEAEMDASDTFVFGGALHGVDAATVVGTNDGEVVMTDGPFAESKEHIAGLGYSKGQTRRARDRLGSAPVKTGMSTGWQWSLPATELGR